MSLQIFTAILISVWCCGIVMNAVCLVTLGRRRLFGAFPVLAGYLLVSLARSLWLLRLYAIGDTAGYSAFWRSTQPVLIVLYALLVVEAVFRMASHFPAIGPFAATLSAVFTILAAAICLASVDVGINPSMVAGLMKLGRFFNLLCLLVLMLARGLFALFDPKMRSNVRVYVVVLGVFFAGGAFAAALAGFMGRGFNPIVVAAQLLTVANPLTAYALWSLRLTPAGEVYEPLALGDPLPGAAQKEQIRIAIVLRAVGRELLKRGTRRLS